MTRKDYVLIAQALAKAYGFFPDKASNHANGCRVAVQEVSEVLARDNPRFDRERFLAACGVQS